MAEVFFDNPPVLQGREKDQLIQLQRYLNTMSEKLNQALTSISIEQMAPETKTIINTGGNAQQEAEKNYETLKNLIIKTAEVIHHEMDEITTTLTSDYVANSTLYGDYEEHVQNDIRVTAEGVMMDFNVQHRITDITQASEDYMDNMNNYIFAGDLGNNVYGIAIGNGVSNVNGEYVAGNQYATFTKDRLSFYNNGAEVAYYSDEKFHITDGEVTRSLKMGQHRWMVLANGGFALVSGVQG